MKKALVTMIIALFAGIISNINAQQVGYTYKALAAEGCTMNYSVIKQNEKYFIIAIVSSDRMTFLNDSHMIVKTSKGDILKFHGKLISTDSKSSSAIVSGNMVIPVSSIISMAQFEVKPEEFELLKDGIIKLRLTTIPIEHEREFKKDKVGKKLYEFYINAKNKELDF